jgi:nucleotide-binding universal stress UspA family protein
MVLTDAQKHHMIAHVAATSTEAIGAYETHQHKERRAQAQLARAAAAYLDEQAQALRAAGLDVTFEVASGTPAARIVAIAAQEPQALIAMATHGYSGLRHWRLGSVADTLVHVTRKPILLVHARAEPPPGTPPLRSILVPL